MDGPCSFQDMEASLQLLPQLKTENITLKGEGQDLRDLLSALDAENKRLTEAELRARQVRGAVWRGTSQ